VTALYLGKRVGHGHEPMPPHNLPFTVIGASLLWVGWFGFNAGSALASNELASTAFVNTNTAAAAAALGWLIAEWRRSGKPTLLGAASGAVAGLVGITPAAGFVTPVAALAIGALAGVVCYAACSLVKPRFGYDDALDVVGVHLVGGTLGALLTGVFATTLVNAAGKNGLLHGNPGLLWTQLVAVVATYGFCGLGTLAILFVVNLITPMRAPQDEEIVGMDLSQHSERAYGLVGGEAVVLVQSMEPRPADVPPVRRERFSVVLDGLDTATMTGHWRNLCQDRGDGTSEEFKAVYSNFSTVRGNRFRFRGGDPQRMRSNLETLFRSVAPGAKARVEEDN
jgi:Amt family ammonium transporter